MISATKKVFIRLILPITAGCAALTKITSNKAPNYNSEPKDIFSLIDLGKQCSDDFYDSFAEKLQNILKDCDAFLCKVNYSCLQAVISS